MANHALPTISSTYSDFVQQLDQRMKDLALGLDPTKTGMSNLPVDSIGWNNTEKKWKTWTGTAWQDLASTYSISISGSADRLSTARSINNTLFNGSANIVVEPFIEIDESTNATRYLTFVDSAGEAYQRLNIDSGLTYNPSNNTIGSNISGNAGSVTAGVYTNGSQSIDGVKTFLQPIQGNITGNSGSVTNGVYTQGNQNIDGIKSFLKPIIGAVQEPFSTIAGNNIDLSVAGFYAKTISANTTFTVSNIPTSGTTCSFVLELTNAGAFSITWWASVKWYGGIAPVLTAAGKDVLAFYTYDGGTNWQGLLLARDIK